MKLVATIKLKLSADKQLSDMTKTFKHAVQYAIDVGYKAKVNNRFNLHKLVYRDLRQWLTADFACCAIGVAAQNLRATKFKVKPVMKSCPITFNRNLFTFDSSNIRVATFTPRQRKDIPIEVPVYYWKYLDWRYQYLQLITDRKGRLFANITFSREAAPVTSCRNEKIGVDLGVNNLAVCSDGRVFKGHKTRLMQFQKLRHKLQAKGTKSAKRLLKKVSGRQKRYMAWVNHNISKRIVNGSGADHIVLEDLKGIRKRTKRRTKRLNRWLHSWSFFQLQQFISYKAAVQGIMVTKVNPYMTSQTCSSCGKHGNRYLDMFYCPHCNVSFHADFNASCNLRRLLITQQDSSCIDVKGHLTTATEHRAKYPAL